MSDYDPDAPETEDDIKKRKPTWQSLLRNTLDMYAPQPSNQPSVQPGSMDNRQKEADRLTKDDDANRLLKRKTTPYGIQR